jgi:hypothetical protein
MRYKKERNKGMKERKKGDRKRMYGQQGPRLMTLFSLTLKCAVLLAGMKPDVVQKHFLTSFILLQC